MSPRIWFATLLLSASGLSQAGAGAPGPLTDWRRAVAGELTGNILPFWFRIEKPGGGYVGGFDSAMNALPDTPVSLILVSRLLWTYARAYRTTGDAAHLGMARRARDYLSAHFHDSRHGGYFWMLDPQGTPVNCRKQIYGQAFVIYALAEFHAATGDADSLAQARRLFSLVEGNSWNPQSGGYWEAFSREWGMVDDLRLSDHDFNAPLTMNAHLHLLEAYTNLLRVTRAPDVEAACRRVLRVMLDRIVVPERTHFGLFFDKDWRRMDRIVSPGHDIEGSWLMWEAAEVIGDPGLLAEVRPVALAMARHTLANGLNPAGGVVDEYEEGKPAGHGTNWWPQAEGVVGFLNAWQLSGDPEFLRAARAVWDYIDRFIVDREHGDWIAGRTPDGAPLDRGKVDPWKASYHNSRACFEVMERLQPIAPGACK